MEVELVEDDGQPRETVDRSPIQVPGGLLLVVALVAAAVGTSVGTFDGRQGDATTGCPASPVCEVEHGSAERRGVCQWQGFTAVMPALCGPASAPVKVDPCEIVAAPSAEAVCRDDAARNPPYTPHGGHP